MKYIALAAFAAVAFFVLRWLQSPKSHTRRLAITVWAAFGPHQTAADAEDVLSRASKAVFGKQGLAKHQNWINGHIENFREWEAEGRFSSAEKTMRRGLSLTAYGRPFREACAKLKAEALDEAQEALDSLGQTFPQIREPFQHTIDHERAALEGRSQKKR